MSVESALATPDMILVAAPHDCKAVCSVTRAESVRDTLRGAKRLPRFLVLLRVAALVVDDKLGQTLFSQFFERFDPLISAEQ